jgi:hypothetical protein
MPNLFRGQFKSRRRACSTSGMPGLVSAGHLSPVHHVPEYVDVLQAAVSVLEVVGVLPRVQPQHRRLPSMSGESWLAVVSIETERSGLTISHAQPEPNRAPGAAAATNCSLRLSSEPKPQVMASARSSPRSSSPPTLPFAEAGLEARLGLAGRSPQHLPGAQVELRTVPGTRHDVTLTPLEAFKHRCRRSRGVAPRPPRRWRASSW